MKESKLKDIPQIEQLLNEPSVSYWFGRISRQLTLNAVHSSVDYYRKRLLEGDAFNKEVLFELIDNQCKALYAQKIRPVINATGIILHNGLG